MQIFIAFPHMASVWLLRHHPPAPEPRWTYCASSRPSSPKKAFLLLSCGWWQLCDFCIHCMFRPTLTCEPLDIFFQPWIRINNTEFGIAENSNDICLTCVSFIGESPGKGLSEMHLRLRRARCALGFVGSVCWGTATGERNNYLMLPK